MKDKVNGAVPDDVLTKLLRSHVGRVSCEHLCYSDKERGRILFAKKLSRAWPLIEQCVELAHDKSKAFKPKYMRNCLRMCVDESWCTDAYKEKLVTKIWKVASEHYKNGDAI